MLPEINNKMKKILFLCLFSYLVELKAQEINNTDTTTYRLKVKLTKAEDPPPHCGTIAWALAQKFEIIESNISFIKPTYHVILIKTCPEFLGANYFADRRIYEVTVNLENKELIGHSILNKYSASNLPTFWIKGIKWGAIVN